jgi:DNA-binding Lrp family transcriptional regulator
MVFKSLDQTDLSILQMLLEDSRVSQNKIAKKLDIPLSTLQKRLHRLKENPIEKFTIVVDPQKLGLGTYLLWISTTVSNIKSIIERIRKEDYVTEVYYSEDGEIIVKAICSNKKFTELYENIIGGFGDKIKGILLLTQPNTKKHTPVINVSELTRLKKKVDEKKRMDLSILHLLLEDSRSTLSSMAKKLGIPLSTLQKKIKKLTDEVIDKYTVIVDPRNVGLDTYMAHITVANVLKVNSIISMLTEEKYVSEVFHREDGEIFVKSICAPEDFVDFYARLQDGFGEHMQNIVLLSKPNPVKHASVIHPSLLDKPKLG